MIVLSKDPRSVDEPSGMRPEPADNLSFDDFELSRSEFFRVAAMVRERFGINLTESKMALVRGRLMKPLRDGGFRTFDEYLDQVEADASGGALSEMVNRISTNYTYFMREWAHFDFFTSVVLPEFEKTRYSSEPRELRIWSAGCSSGEEPYSIAMILAEYFGKSITSWDIGILATDISSRVLDRAAEGRYPVESAKLVPPEMAKKYFTVLPDGRVEIVPELRKMVLFKRFNLIKDDYPFRRTFHAVFCRNVMIYFDSATRSGLVERFFRFMEPGGYLMVGHSESLDRKLTSFQYVSPSIYKKPLV